MGGKRRKSRKKEGRSPVFNQPYGGYVCPRIMQTNLDIVMFEPQKRRLTMIL